MRKNNMGRAGARLLERFSILQSKPTKSKSWGKFEESLAGRKCFLTYTIESARVTQRTPERKISIYIIMSLFSNIYICLFKCFKALQI
jgi:hypothetical protein